MQIVRLDTRWRTYLVFMGNRVYEEELIAQVLLFFSWEAYSLTVANDFSFWNELSLWVDFVTPSNEAATTTRQLQVVLKGHRG